jgi:GH18 family chitinase
MKKPFAIVGILACCSLASAQAKYVGWSTGYYTNWTNTNSYPFTKIDWKAYTHVVYFSASPNGNGGNLSNGVSDADAKKFTSLAHQNGSKALICVGGAGSGDQYNTATSSGNRAAFIQNMVNLMQKDGFDGIDIDWEEKFNNAQYLALFKELRAALDAISPKPLLTVATAEYFAGTTAPAAQYCDQINLMSYWTDVNGMPGQMKSFTDKGVDKTKLGVGYGYDTDGETDVNNPKDIGAKCAYALKSGFGGIMIWEIARACAACDDSTAHYVDKTVTGVRPMDGMRSARMRAATLSITTDGVYGAREIRYTVPEIAGGNQGSGSPINLSLYDAGGTLVKTMVDGNRKPGAYILPLDGKNGSGSALRPAAYMVKMSTPTGVSAAEAVITR